MSTTPSTPPTNLITIDRIIANGPPKIKEEHRRKRTSSMMSNNCQNFVPAERSFPMMLHFVPIERDGSDNDDDV
jgi:hypothetical protein